MRKNVELSSVPVLIYQDDKDRYKVTKAFEGDYISFVTYNKFAEEYVSIYGKINILYKHPLTNLPMIKLTNVFVDNVSINSDVLDFYIKDLSNVKKITVRNQNER